MWLGWAFPSGQRSLLEECLDLKILACCSWRSRHRFWRCGYWKCWPLSGLLNPMPLPWRRHLGSSSQACVSSGSISPENRWIQPASSWVLICVLTSEPSSHLMLAIASSCTVQTVLVSDSSVCPLLNSREDVGATPLGPCRHPGVEQAEEPQPCRYKFPLPRSPLSTIWWPLNPRCPFSPTFLTFLS